MTSEMKKDLERFGRVEKDYKTWVRPWTPYYNLYCGDRHRDILVKVLSRKYEDFIFYKGECHICNNIYMVIKFERKQS